MTSLGVLRFGLLTGRFGLRLLGGWNDEGTFTFFTQSVTDFAQSGSIGFAFGHIFGLDVVAEVAILANVKDLR
ncbi:unnamed protein product [marine sediment metagenome]|uniref:Uncharacterized protein n=1 Tax=marine sediment metagenome TaxID=412755 RepID=X1MKH6_9ZZZZ